MKSLSKLTTISQLRDFLYALYRGDNTLDFDVARLAFYNNESQLSADTLWIFPNVSKTQTMATNANPDHPWKTLFDNGFGSLEEAVNYISTLKPNNRKVRQCAAALARLKQELIGLGLKLNMHNKKSNVPVTLGLLFTYVDIVAVEAVDQDIAKLEAITQSVTNLRNARRRLFFLLLPDDTLDEHCKQLVVSNFNEAHSIYSELLAQHETPISIRNRKLLTLCLKGYLDPAKPNYNPADLSLLLSDCVNYSNGQTNANIIVGNEFYRILLEILDQLFTPERLNASLVSTFKSQFYYPDFNFPDFIYDILANRFGSKKVFPLRILERAKLDNEIIPCASAVFDRIDYTELTDAERLAVSSCLHPLELLKSGIKSQVILDKRLRFLTAEQHAEYLFLSMIRTATISGRPLMTELPQSAEVIEAYCAKGLATNFLKILRKYLASRQLANGLHIDEKDRYYPASVLQFIYWLSKISTNNNFQITMTPEDLTCFEAVVLAYNADVSAELVSHKQQFERDNSAELVWPRLQSILSEIKQFFKTKSNLLEPDLVTTFNKLNAQIQGRQQMLPIPVFSLPQIPVFTQTQALRPAAVQLPPQVSVVPVARTNHSEVDRSCAATLRKLYNRYYRDKGLSTLQAQEKARECFQEIKAKIDDFKRELVLSCTTNEEYASVKQKIFKFDAALRHLNTVEIDLNSNNKLIARESITQIPYYDVIALVWLALQDRDPAVCLVPNRIESEQKTLYLNVFDYFYRVQRHGNINAVTGHDNGASDLNYGIREVTSLISLLDRVHGDAVIDYDKINKAIREIIYTYLIDNIPVEKQVALLKAFSNVNPNDIQNVSTSAHSIQVVFPAVKLKVHEYLNQFLLDTTIAQSTKPVTLTEDKIMDILSRLQSMELSTDDLIALRNKLKPSSTAVVNNHSMAGATHSQDTAETATATILATLTTHKRRLSIYNENDKSATGKPPEAKLEDEDSTKNNDNDDNDKSEQNRTSKMRKTKQNTERSLG